MRSTTARLCIASGCILIFPSIGSAQAAAPIYWPPGRMVKALIALQYPHPGILNGTCKGLSKARRGTYMGFRCLLDWQTSGTTGLESGRSTVWARPLARGRVCGSTMSLKLCRPLAQGPLAGDPTICSANDRVLCLHNAAVMAARRHVGGPGGAFQGQVSCTQTGPLTFSCTLGTGVYTVRFTKGVSQWLTTVTP